MPKCETVIEESQCWSATSNCLDIDRIRIESLDILLVQRWRKTDDVQRRATISTITAATHDHVRRMGGIRVCIEHVELEVGERDRLGTFSCQGHDFFVVIRLRLRLQLGHLNARIADG